MRFWWFGTRADDAQGAERAGAYRLLRELGRGRFGVVYEAEHVELESHVALKVLHAGFDAASLARCFAQADRASALRHEHVITQLASGTTAQGRGYCAMPLLSGMTLDRFMMRHGALEPQLALGVLTRLASALDALHAAGIVHGYLRPESLFLHYDAAGTRPVLMDVGVRELLSETGIRTLAGAPLARPFYVAPEQVREEDLDARADVYAFGALCHELLTGEPPISGGSTLAVRMAHLDTPPRRASEVRPELAALDEALLPMLAKARDDRPPGVGVACEALARASGYRPGPLHLPRPEGREPNPPPLEEDEERLFTLPARLDTPRRPRPKLPWGMIALLGAMIVVVYLLAQARAGHKLVPGPGASERAKVTP